VERGYESRFGALAVKGKRLLEGSRICSAKLQEIQKKIYFLDVIVGKLGITPFY